jgi:wobble nucleotide-excising tRNase
MTGSESFSGMSALAETMRQKLENKQIILIYAYNGTGKTRLSMAFKDIGKKTYDDGDTTERDTLYFNAFTEDLFYWDNDLANDRQRVLKLNKGSRFFSGLEQLEMDNRIRPLLDRYADFDFKIDATEWEVSFSREIMTGEGDHAKAITVEDIKVSRGEENIFIWCFFLAIVQLVLDGDEAYKWVKYVYIDDPISSLDENNAIAVANHLAQMLTDSEKGPKTVISSHHVLFFNVLCNELKKKAHRHFLKKGATPGSFALQDTTSRPFLYHLSMLVDLNEAQLSGDIYTYHFNIMRRAMEQTASFFGLEDWKQCIKVEAGDSEGKLYKRIIDLMSHGDYSLYEPREMMDDNKKHFRNIFRQFIAAHPFNPALFPSETE